MSTAIILSVLCTFLTASISAAANVEAPSVRSQCESAFATFASDLSAKQASTGLLLRHLGYREGESPGSFFKALFRPQGLINEGWGVLLGVLMSSHDGHSIPMVERLKMYLSPLFSRSPREATVGFAGWFLIYAKYYESQNLSAHSIEADRAFVAYAHELLKRFKSREDFLALAFLGINIDPEQITPSQLKNIVDAALSTSAGPFIRISR